MIASKQAATAARRDHHRSSTAPWRLLLAVLAATAAIFGCSSTPRTESPETRSYTFWPQFPAEPRMQFLMSYQYSDDVEPADSGLEELIYGKKQATLPIAKPYGVAMWNGRIYVCDTRNAAVVVLDLKAKETRLMGASGMGRLSSPTDIAITADGMKYVSDATRGAVFVYDADERHVASLGEPGFKPTGVAVAGKELFVCDFKSQQVKVLDRFTGDVLREIGGPGDEDGQFVRPLGIDVDAEGVVYVSDVIRCNVQKFSPDGTFLGAFGGIGDSVGSFVRPKLLAIDSENVVYVVDAAFANVQMFNDDDAMLMFFGAAGPHAGSMKLPVGVSVSEGEDDLDLFQEYVHPAFEAKRLVLVTNQFGPNKVSVYAMGGLRKGRTVQDIATAQSALATGTREGANDLSEVLFAVPPEVAETERASEDVFDDTGAQRGRPPRER